MSENNKKKSFEPNIKKQMLVGLSALLILLISISLLFFLSNKSKRDADREDMLKSIASNVYNAVTDEIACPINISNVMANDSFLINSMQNETAETENEMVITISDYLKNLKSATNSVTTFVVSDKTKRYYSYNGLNKVIDPENDEHDDWYRIFIDSGKSYTVDIDKDQVNGDVWTAFINFRLTDISGNLLGVCGVGTEIDTIQKLIRDYEERYNVDIRIVDQDGVPQVDNSSVSINKRYLYDVKYSEANEFVYTSEKGGVDSVSKYLDELSWYLIVKDKDSSSISEYAPVFCLAALCFALSVAFYIAMCLLINKKQNRK